MRLLPEGVGGAYVDERTPQLGIALEAAFQHKGYGGRHCWQRSPRSQAAGYRQVSLTVHPENPANALYEHCGFRKSGLRHNYYLMLASVA